MPMCMHIHRPLAMAIKIVVGYSVESEVGVFVCYLGVIWSGVVVEEWCALHFTFWLQFKHSLPSRALTPNNNRIVTAAETRPHPHDHTHIPLLYGHLTDDFVELIFIFNKLYTSHHTIIHGKYSLAKYFHGNKRGWGGGNNLESFCFYTVPCVCTMHCLSTTTVTSSSLYYISMATISLVHEQKLCFFYLDCSTAF